MRKTIMFGWLRIVAGLLVFAFGVHLTIYANIGLAPWDCLGMGVAKHTPLNYIDRIDRSGDRHSVEGKDRFRNGH